MPIFGNWTNFDVWPYLEGMTMFGRHVHLWKIPIFCNWTNIEVWPYLVDMAIFGKMPIFGNWTNFAVWTYLEEITIFGKHAHIWNLDGIMGMTILITSTLLSEVCCIMSWPDEIGFQERQLCYSLLIKSLWNILLWPSKWIINSMIFTNITVLSLIFRSRLPHINNDTWFIFKFSITKHHWLHRRHFEYNDFLKKLTTNVLHGFPSRTLLYVINTILSTHVRVQSLKSVFEVQVFWCIYRQHVHEPTMIIFRWISQRVEKFRLSTWRKIKHSPM